MDWLHRIRRTCSGLVAAVMLWSAAMPALALALKGPPGSKESWVEVCTSRGTLMLKRVVFETADTPTTAINDPSAPGQPDHSLATSLTHCPYCPTVGLDTSVTSAAYAWFVMATDSTALPTPSQPVLAHPHRWTLPPGNGPPRSHV